MSAFSHIQRVATRDAQRGLLGRHIRGRLGSLGPQASLWRPSLGLQIVVHYRLTGCQSRKRRLVYESVNQLRTQVLATRQRISFQGTAAARLRRLIRPTAPVVSVRATLWPAKFTSAPTLQERESAAFVRGCAETKQTVGSSHDERTKVLYS